MNIFYQILFDTDKDFKKLCQQSFQLWFCWSSVYTVLRSVTVCAHFWLHSTGYEPGLRLCCAIPLELPIVKTWVHVVGLILLLLSIFSPPCVNCSIYCGGVLKFSIYCSKKRHCVCALLAASNRFIWHLSQFWQNVKMFCNIFDQKNCYNNRTLITSLFKCSVIVKSCVYWISLVQRDSEFNTQCLFQKSNFSSLLKEHFIMNTLTLSTVKNDLCFLWINEQSSLYNSSSVLAFSYICLRSVISLNKF